MLLMLAFASACAAGYDQASNSSEVERTVTEVQLIAASEPLIAGIDTRFRLAQYLKNSDPKMAEACLKECTQQFAAIADSDAVAELGAKVVDLLFDISPPEAERAAKALPRRSAPERMNALEAAYDTLVARTAHLDRAKAERLIYSAFGAGAFRLYAGRQLLLSDAQENVVRAQELFAQFLNAFPADTADTRDMMFLLECSRAVMNSNPALAAQAVSKVLQSVDRSSFEEAGSPTLTSRYRVGQREYAVQGRRDSVLFQIALFQKIYDPEAYKANLEKFRAFESATEGLSKGDLGVAMEPIGTSYAPRTRSGEQAGRGAGFLAFMDGLRRKPFADAVSAIEGLPDEALRAELLGVQLGGGRGTKDERRRAALLLLKWTSDLKDYGMRAHCLGVLLDRFRSPEDADIAQDAVSQLNATLDPLCKCEGWKLEPSAPDCRPELGSARCPEFYAKIAEYLFNNKVPLDERTNPSVRARYLLMSLRER